MQHMESEGKWGDVLLGKYDKQREDERGKTGCTDVSQKQIQEMHMFVSSSHTQTLEHETVTSTDKRNNRQKKIWSVLSWLAFFVSVLSLLPFPPQCLFFHSGASPSVSFPVSLPTPSSLQRFPSVHQCVCTPSESGEYQHEAVHTLYRHSYSLLQSRCYILKTLGAGVVLVPDHSPLKPNTHSQTKLKLMISDFFSLQQMKFISSNSRIFFTVTVLLIY